MFDNIFQAIGLPLILAGLSACANPSYVAPSHPIKIFQMERPVYFLSSEVPACGDPIAQEDVLVVNVDIDEDIGKAVQTKKPISRYNLVGREEYIGLRWGMR